MGRSAAIAGCALLPRQLPAARGRRGGKPNIIFILADDLGYADLSCYGRTEYRTPNIDGLARAGMKFVQAYANSAVCSATRVGLITGRYQDRLAAGLEEPIANRDVGLPAEHPTLPTLLRVLGYKTNLVGKWHLGSLPTYGPLQSGYDHFWGFRGGAVDYFTHDFAGRADLWDDDRAIQHPGYLTDLLGDVACQTVERHARTDEPFLLSLHFNAPHWPWEGPDDQAESQRLAADKTAGGIVHYDGGALKTYAAMVNRMDTQIGRVLKSLARAGIARDTIVIFTSDNGGERYSNTWPFSGKKTELLEGGLRIPAIVRWPGVVPAGSMSDQVMMSMDWLPTLLAAAGGRPDPAFPSDGIDLGAILRAGAPPVSRMVCWRYLNLAQEACRDGDWKYLKILKNTFLFNVADDPQERANLKGRHPDIYQRLVAEYHAWEATMLPLDFGAFTSGFTGDTWADHFGVNKSRMTAPDKD